MAEDFMSESTSGHSEAAGLPEDILARVREDFGPERADEVYRYLLDRVPDGLPNGTRPRHLRCILYLAQGDRALLDRYIELCLQDTRDVMLQAEYETRRGSDLRRVRDFAKPFDQARLRRRTTQGKEEE
jgi:hypothetical protein